MDVRGLHAAALILLIAALLAPLRAARQWRGGWRAMALLPPAGLGLVVIRAALAPQRDPLSRGMIPFEILLASLGAIIVTAGLRLAHAIARAGDGA